MWSEIAITDTAALQRFLNVMHKTGLRNQWLSLMSVRSRMKRDSGKFYEYVDPDINLFLPIYFQAKHDRFCLCPSFLGRATPQRALDLIVAKVADFFAETGRQEIYGLRPRRMDYPPLAAMFNLVPTDPQIIVTTIADMPDSIIWKLQLRP